MGEDVRDPYYTPAEIADRLVAALPQSLGAGRAVLMDPSCGRGSLLAAAERRWPHAVLRGLDQDVDAVRLARQLGNGRWDVRVGSAYPSLVSPSCWQSELVDCLLLNPPFTSYLRQVGVAFGGRDVHCGYAMAYVLASLAAFEPTNGACCILPESCLYSNRDRTARSILEQRFSMCTVEELGGTTFQGTRAKSALVRLVPAESVTPAGTAEVEARTNVLGRLTVKLVRGGMPIFQSHSRTSASGCPLLHSTDLAVCALAGWDSGSRVAPLNRGVVKGHVVLLPRVGVVRRAQIAEVRLPSLVQLSDCVIGLVCDTTEVAAAVRDRILDNWDEFVQLYKGTGAPYVTLTRLKVWLAMHNIGLA